MRPARLRVPAAALAVVLVAGACGSPSPTPSVASPTPTPIPSATATPAPTASGGPTSLTWSPSTLGQTAELAVPRDYANPSAGTITLAIARRPAADPAHRIGVLFVNPGGPGAPGYGIAGSIALPSSIPQAVLDRFDVISWDPRGVGRSDGLGCPDDATVGTLESLDPDPQTAAALAAYRAAFDATASQCQAASGGLLPFLAEANTAHDMDAIRAALGEATISYIGWSYGTYLGYLYATMFPTHLRAAVLDGPVNPTLDLVGRDASQARGFERAFDHFVAVCAAAPHCPFHGGGDPAKAYDALIARLERSPDSGLDAGQAVLGTVSWLYGRDWPGLAAALSAAEHGDGQALRQAADAYFGGVSVGSYEATLCLDVPHPTSTAAIAAAASAARKAAPRFGAFVVLSDQYGCLDWPGSAAPGPPAATQPPSGLPPILVVAGTWDPATPAWDAAPLAKALGTGVVLTRDGLGHTSGSSASTDPCLRDALVAYLVGLRAPAAGTICTDGPAFSWP